MGMQVFFNFFEKICCPVAESRFFGGIGAVGVGVRRLGWGFWRRSGSYQTFMEGTPPLRGVPYPVFKCGQDVKVNVNFNTNAVF